jgi:hypothetical protein
MLPTKFQFIWQRGKIKIFLFTTDDITGLGHRIITTYRSYSYRKHVIAADLHWSELIIWINFQKKIIEHNVS